MNIKVCVGSSCHLKGSYDVILAMKDILKKYDVEDLVELQASFCLGHCAQGVNIKTDDIPENMMKKASISAEDGFLLLLWCRLKIRSGGHFFLWSPVSINVISTQKLTSVS